jgi:cob(I)alamin adenosyltransferase
VKVYTRTGDDGSTGLFHGGRVAKSAIGPSAYGTVDEAVSVLGLARAEARATAVGGVGGAGSVGSELDALLQRLQRELFVAGAELATGPDRRHLLEPAVSRVTPAMVEALEPVIDDITTRFEAPREFVLPGENRLAAALDVARTVVRRAEREAVAATEEGWLEPESSVVPYLNRLADLVYTLARWQEGQFRAVRESP